MTVPETTIFSSEASLLDSPIARIPSILHLENDTLTYLILEYGTFTHKGLKALFELNGRRLKIAKPDFPLALFSHPTSALSRFHIPWYYFGASCKMTIERRAFRFSFVRPQNTVELSLLLRILQ